VQWCHGWARISARAARPIAGTALGGKPSVARYTAEHARLVPQQIFPSPRRLYSAAGRLRAAGAARLRAAGGQHPPSLAPLAQCRCPQGPWRWRARRPPAASCLQRLVVAAWTARFEWLSGGSVVRFGCTWPWVACITVGGRIAARRRDATACDLPPTPCCVRQIAPASARGVGPRPRRPG
jgi:hypothetical protein